MECHIIRHDEFFKRSMINLRIAEDFLRQNLPKKILKQIDFKTLKIELGTFVDNNLQMRMTDMLYSVKMRGAKAYIYILVEHQSTADILMPFRLVEYKVRIIRHYLDTGGDPRKLPIVVPIVLYNGLVKYPYSCDLFDLFDDPLNIAKEVWVAPFNLLDLTNTSDEEIRKRQWVAIMEYMLKHIRKRNALPYLRDLINALKLMGETEDKDYIFATLQFAVTAGEVRNGEEFLNFIRNDLGRTEEDKIMTLAKQWEQQGRQEGLQEGVIMGRQEGLEQGRMEIAKNLLYQGHSVEMVVKATKLPVDVIQQLSDEILVH